MRALGLSQLHHGIQRARHCAQGAIEIRDESAASRTPFDADHPLLFESPESFAERDAAGIKLQGHVPLRRELVAGLDSPTEDGLSQLLCHCFRYPLALQRSDAEGRDGVVLGHLVSMRQSFCTM